jgi:hypothetical protein
MVRTAVLALVVALVAGPRPALTAAASRARITVRAFPATVIPPASVLLVAELQGDEDHEDFQCPEIEWDWADGTRSRRQSDCAPDGTAVVEHRFSLRHSFREGGLYRVSFRLRRADRLLSEGSTTVMVYAEGEN